MMRPLSVRTKSRQFCRRGSFSFLTLPLPLGRAVPSHVPAKKNGLTRVSIQFSFVPLSTSDRLVLFACRKTSDDDTADDEPRSASPSTFLQLVCFVLVFANFVSRHTLALSSSRVCSFVARVQTRLACQSSSHVDDEQLATPLDLMTCRILSTRLQHVIQVSQGSIVHRLVAATVSMQND